MILNFSQKPNRIVSCNKAPDNPFSITIYRQSLPFFDPIEQYKDKKVRVTGEVNKFKDKRTGKDRFSIVLKKPEQIEILD